MRWELEIQKSDGKQGLRNARGLLKRFDLKELVEARLCRIVTGGDERGLKFEYDPNISNALVGSEKVLGSCLQSLSAILGIDWNGGTRCCSAGVQRNRRDIEGAV